MNPFLPKLLSVVLLITATESKGEQTIISGPASQYPEYGFSKYSCCGSAIKCQSRVHGFLAVSSCWWSGRKSCSLLYTERTCGHGSLHFRPKLWISGFAKMKQAIPQALTTMGRVPDVLFYLPVTCEPKKRWVTFVKYYITETKRVTNTLIPKSGGVNGDKSDHVVNKPSQLVCVKYEKQFRESPEHYNQSLMNHFDRNLEYQNSDRNVYSIPCSWVSRGEQGPCQEFDWKPLTLFSEKEFGYEHSPRVWRS